MSYYIVYDSNRDSVSVINYEPNVPSDIKIIEISETEKFGMDQGIYYFDKTNQTVIKKALTEIQSEGLTKKTQQENAQHQDFLNSTDWKVLRHIREVALNQSTTLSQEEYIDLEKERSEAAKSIKK